MRAIEMEWCVSIQWHGWTGCKYNQIIVTRKRVNL